MIPVSVLRTQHQQIHGSRFENVHDLVAWMGAMQAQDFTMMKWAVGLRVQNATEPMIEQAFAKGEVLRTHVLRPTWHLVAPEDIHWMLSLTAPNIRPSLNLRLRRLGIDPATITRSQSVLTRELERGNHLTREEIAEKLELAGIEASGLSMSHLLMACELDGLICSGAPKGKIQTYALLDERATNRKPISRDEALFRLAGRYFTSHGPATLQDFCWWSGLGMKDVRRAFELIKNDFEVMHHRENEYLISGNRDVSPNPRDLAVLVPAYDEFIISYRDRTDALDEAHQQKVISSNGIFWPTVVIGGKVAGLWRKTKQKNTVSVQYDLFRTLSHAEKKALENAESQFLRFLAG